MNIRFGWQGKKYSVGMDAYDHERIILPDGTSLRPNGWLESYPPQLAGVTEEPHLFKNLKPEEIARQLGSASVAVEIK